MEVTASQATTEDFQKTYISQVATLLTESILKEKLPYSQFTSEVQRALQSIIQKLEDGYAFLAGPCSLVNPAHYGGEFRAHNQEVIHLFLLNKSPELLKDRILDIVENYNNIGLCPFSRLSHEDCNTHTLDDDSTVVEASLFHTYTYSDIHIVIQKAHYDSLEDFVTTCIELALTSCNDEKNIFFPPREAVNNDMYQKERDSRKWKWQVLRSYREGPFSRKTPPSLHEQALRVIMQIKCLRLERNDKKL